MLSESLKHHHRQVRAQPPCCQQLHLGWLQQPILAEGAGAQCFPCASEESWLQHYVCWQIPQSGGQWLSFSLSYVNVMVWWHAPAVMTECMSKWSVKVNMFACDWIHERMVNGMNMVVLHRFHPRDLRKYKIGECVQETKRRYERQRQRWSMGTGIKGFTNKHEDRFQHWLDGMDRKLH